jgi:hypothetical protein
VPRSLYFFIVNNFIAHVNTQERKSMGYFAVPDDIFEEKISASQKLVLINLCRRADNEGISFPSHKRIAQDCGISKRTVKRAIVALKKANLIGYQSGTGREATAYILCPYYREIRKWAPIESNV